MKHITLTICVAAILLFSCNNDSTKTSDAKTDTTKMTEQPVAKETPPSATLPDSATMMKNWQSYATPGDMQKMMASWTGNWDADITMWDKPGAPPTKSTGKTVNKMIMGGRYQQSVHTATMMGMPFEGQGLLAYDNAKKAFQSTWVDNMGTGLMNLTGTWNAATKSLTLTGRSVDPSTLADKDFKEVMTVIDDNSQTLAMFTNGQDGKEMKMMEIKYTRRK
jgi:hypothetical protein